MIEDLKKIIETKLPGETAHIQMAPTNRPLSSIALKNETNIKQSSVAVILVENKKQFEIILIQRPSYEGNRSEQVSFPGGKKELSDNDLTETAIRECFEEIGVELKFENFVGKLTPVYIPVSNFRVDANLFHLDTTPEFVKDEREVDAIFTIRVEDLMQDRFVKKTTIEMKDFTLKEVPYFDLGNKQIWGATALILNELKEVLKQLKT